MNAMVPESQRNDGPARQIVYLTNVYPAPSHSFIRREIRALENAGWTVHRFAHRTCTGGLIEPEDILEQTKTRVLLDQPRVNLVLGVLSRLLKEPVAFFRSLFMSQKMVIKGDRRWVAHVAYFIQACSLAKQMKQLGCRHVHVHFGTNPAAVACLASQFSGLSYSATFHGPHEYDPELKLNLDTKIQHARFIAAVSRAGKQTLDRLYPTYQDKFMVVPCGLDESWLQRQRHAISTGADKPNDYFLTIARLDPQKNIPMLLDAVKQLTERDVAVRVLIAGDGYLRAELEQYIDRLGIGEQVELLGWQTQDQIHRLLDNARAMLLASQGEGLPIAIMEAFAHRIPAIATDVGGVNELVINETTGWLVSANDAASLATAMEDCLTSRPARLKKMGDAGRKLLDGHQVAHSQKLLSDAFTVIHGQY
ncbi:glycosyltransferase family 4 protein [Ketobacter sp. MCCC 1A13808]|nr:glycosyltransferase family 4 protein [Ketobacter sp. MCCC 1A13808]